MGTNEFAYNETAFDHQRGDDYWGISTGERKWINKLEKYSKSHPNDVKILANNTDGSIFAHVPNNWIKVSPPRKVSDEQREAFRQRVMMGKNS